MSLLALSSVTRRFVGTAEVVVAVHDVSLAVAPGELVAVVGPSGSGKTTLLHLALGWDEPDDGQVHISTEVRDRAGWSGLSIVPQELGLLPELTAAQNVELALRLAGRPADFAEVADALALTGLMARPPDQLSLGEQQRFAVARAVACGPLLLVADEPTAHQDERNADRVMEVLAGVAGRGGGVLVATHDERLLDRVDRVVSLLDGRVVATRAS